MTQPHEPTLVYESGVAGALMPGEQVLWEEHPHPPPPSTQAPPTPKPIRSAAAVILLTTATAGIAGIGTHGDPLFITLAALVMIGLSVTAIFVSQRKRTEEQPEQPHILYRITDRRVLRSDTRPGKPCSQTEIAAMTSITTVQGPRPQITIDSVEFTDLADANDVMLRLLGLWSRSGRRKRVRRMPSPESIHQLPLSRSPLAGVPALPPQVILAQDERVLWIGRPRVGGPMDASWLLSRLGLLAWLLIPTALLLLSLGIFTWAPRIHWGVGAMAATWLLLGLYSMTIGSIVASRRQARVTYILTNIRAINHTGGRKAITRSHLLDMVSYVNLTHPREGVANVSIGYAHFESIPEAEADQLQPIALAAVRAAGIAPDGIITPHDPDEDELD